MQNEPFPQTVADDVCHYQHEALRLSESRYRRLFETAQDGILLLNAVSAQIEDVNPFLIDMLGYTHPEFLGKKIWEVGAFADVAQSKEMFKELQEKGYVRYDDLPLKTKAGIRIQVEFVSNSYDCEGIKVIQCNIRDITERKADNLKMQRHISLYAALSECNKAIVHCKSKQELFLQICTASVNYGGMKMASVCLLETGTDKLRPVAGFGEGFNKLDDIEISASADSQFGLGPIGTAVREKRPVWCQDFMHDPLTLPWREYGIQSGWASMASLPLFQNQLIIGTFVLYSAELKAFDEEASNLLKEMASAISFALDNLEREKLRLQATHEIEKLAFYDPLTALPNRRLLHIRLQQRLTDIALQHQCGAILMLDLDNFKNLNDTMGHNIGDLLLIEVAVRLQACIGDKDTVARLGGDEFIVILADLDVKPTQAEIEAEAIADRILATLSQIYLLKDYPYHSTTSIGISLFCGGEPTESELLKRTDTAMYQAKSVGGNAKRLYDPEMQQAMQVRNALAHDLRNALVENQFSLYYQMQVDKNSHIVGAEALLRWHHPQHGLVLPALFIHLAEEMGLIAPIGRWVLNTACAQLKAWESVPLLSDLTLAVNVSSRQFFQPDFDEQIIAMLKNTGINPGKLKLELTETVLLDDIDDTNVKMHALRACGLSFSLDDFGTGYSSLSYLTQLPVDQLKIDQSFVRNIGLKVNDALIVQTIIGMAQNLGMTVIAEGVETEAQRDFLERHGCYFYQGYLFCKPMPIAKFEAKFKARKLSSPD